MKTEAVGSDAGLLAVIISKMNENLKAEPPGGAAGAATVRGGPVFPGAPAYGLGQGCDVSFVFRSLRD